jgi:3-oxoacyl-[acyl-carrier-protein] synthase II
MAASIVGRGAVASIGSTPEEIFEALCAGRSGIGTPKAFDLGNYRTRHAFEIDDRPPGGGDEPLRATSWLLTAIGDALADAGLDAHLGDVPVLVGTTLREVRSAELAWRDGVAFDTDRLHFGPALRETFGATTTYTITNACAASLYALGLALDLIEAGAETVVVAGVDTISESTFGLLDRCYPEAPVELRPFDTTRQGMLQGEGAAAVVLHASRGRAKHGVVRSVAINCDAHHPSAPDTANIATAIRDAQHRAGVTPADVDLVLLHGTGTVLNDEAEARAMAEVFTDPATMPAATAIKCMTGHTAGASGLHSLLVAGDSLRTGTVPGITTLTDPMPEAAALRPVRRTTTVEPMNLAQVHSFGFGGLNAVALLERAPA